MSTIKGFLGSFECCCKPNIKHIEWVQVSIEKITNYFAEADRKNNINEIATRRTKS